MKRCLRKNTAWIEVRLSRRSLGRSQRFCGKYFRIIRTGETSAYPFRLDFVIKDFWFGPLVVILEHWREVDA